MDTPSRSEPVTPPGLSDPAPTKATDSLLDREEDRLRPKGSLLDDESQTRDVLIGKLQAEYNAAMATAQKALDEGRYDEGKQQADNAKRLVERYGEVLSPSQREDMVSSALKLYDRISEASLEASKQADADRLVKSQTEAASQKAAAEQKKQENIRELLLKVRQLQMEMKYDQALDILDQILFTDPNNPAALTLRDVIESARLYRKYSDVQRRRNFGYGELSLEAAEAGIPPRENHGKAGPKSLSGSLVYPEDWDKLTLYRKTYDATGWVRGPADQEVERRLDRTIECSDGDAKNLDGALKWWMSQSKVPLFVNWSALKKLKGGAVQKEAKVGKIEIPTLLNGTKAIVCRTLLERIFESLIEDEGGDPITLEGKDKPRIEVIDGYVLVSSADDLQSRHDSATPRVYDIRDLVFKEKNFVSTGIPSAGGNGGGGGSGGGSGGGGGGGGSGFGGGGGGGSGGGGSGGGGSGGSGTVSEDKERTKEIEERVLEIKNLIKKVVDPIAWQDQTAKMEDFDQKLIITALPETHRHLMDLLKQIRDMKALEIGIEVRVLQINSEWFEQIGIDLDMYFNTNSALYDAARSADPNMGLRDFFFQPGVTVPNGQNSLKNPVVFGGIGGTDVPANQIATGSAIGTSTNPISNSIAYQQGSVGPPLGVIKRGDQYANGQTSSGFGPVQMQQEGLRLTDALAAGGISSVMGLAALANPAMTVGMTFLDDVQVDLLVQATQADQRNAVLTAPRLTLLNGQQSAVSIGKTINYVSGFTPGTGNSTGVPIVTPFNGGISMTLQAVASADRRYVTMTVYFQENNLEGFDTQDIQQSVAGGGTGGGGSATSRNQIQLPRYRTTQINTSVSVPDKGTVMLGGQKYTTDYEVEVGVPVLSKIPVVNRFFTNRVNSKVENNLLLLIRPEVMIQAEAEDRLFPGLLGSRDQVAGDSEVR